MVSRFSVLINVALLFSFMYNISSMQDFYGDNINFQNFRHPNSTVLVPGVPNKVYFYHANSVGFQYANLPTETALLNDLEKKYGHIFKYFKLELTVVDQRIWAAQISSNVRKDRELLKPMFKFVANINGDDGVGRSLMLSLIQYLLYSYGVNPRITRMINNIDIWIIPTINYYGFLRSKPTSCEDSSEINNVTNVYGMHLDEIFENSGFHTEETIIMELIKKFPFVLSGNLQGGAIVASYPFDSSERPEKHGVPSLTPDDAIFKKLAKDYSDRNSMMKSGTACNNYFPGGITNGHFWRKKTNGMQDYNYLHSSCFEITLYVSCCKFPLAQFLPFYWNANLESMLKLIENTRIGVYGLVEQKGKKDIPIENAVIRVEGNEHEIKGTDRGEYWRLLIPGSYNVTASAPACLDETKSVELTVETPYVQVNFSLTRQGIYGVVKYDSKPLIGAFVSCMRTENMSEVVTQVQVNDEGKYWFLLEPSDKVYRIAATAPHYFNMERFVEITINNPYVEVQFHMTKITKKTRLY